MQSSGDQKPVKAMTPKRTASLEADLGLLPGLQPCKIRRNYLCKECDYATTNPREFLYHQRDTHNQKGSIHECPYCVYASPHSHKLNRHVNIIHSPSRSQLAPTKSQPLPPSPQRQQFPSPANRRTATVPPPPPPSPSTRRPRPTLPQGPPRLSRATAAAAALRSPPPLMRQVTLTTNGSPKLEVILLEEEQEKEEEEEEEEEGKAKDEEGGGGGGGGGLLPISTSSTLDCSASLKKSIRQLLMEPTSVVSPIPPPMPKLTGKPAKVLPAAVRRPSNGVALSALVKTTRLLRTPSLSHRSAAKVSLLHKEYSCSLCSFKSRSNIVVQQHEKVFHLKKKFFRCTKCNYVTNVRSRYTKHLRYHSMPYIKCNLCDFSTPYKWNLDRHLRYHLGGGASFCGQGLALGPLGGGGGNDMHQDSAFKCERCSFLATSNQSLNMHVLNHHGGKPRPRRIESGLVVDNGESTMTDDSLKENEVVKRENDDRDTMACDGYGEEEKEEGEEEEEEEEEVEETMAAELTTDKGHTDDCPAASASSIYTCSECEDRFSSVPLLDRHMYECHDIDNPRIPMKRTNPNAANRFRDTKNVVQCDVCSYKAKWVSEMVKHRRVHTQDKPYACLQCKFRTRWKGDMTRHVMRYHDGIGKVEQASGTTTGASTDNIDCLLDQSMTVGGEGELCIWSPEGNEQDIPLDLSLAGGEDGEDVEGGAAAAAAAADDDDPLLEEEVDADHRDSRSRRRPPQSYSDQASQNSIRLSGGKIVHKKYQCPHCNFLTPTPSRFHMHIVAHINPKPFMCSECGYRSNWQWDITKHSKMKSIRDRAHLSASVVCVNEYGSSNYDRYEQYAVYDMENSIADVDGNKEDPQNDSRTAAALSSSRRITYKCKHCDFKNPVKKMVVRHMVVHSSTKQKRFCCGVCGHASHWKYIVLRHCHHVHGTSGPILLKDSSPASPPTSEDVHKATSSKNDGEIGDVDSHERAEQLGGDLGHLPKDDVSIADPKDDKDKRHKCSICPYRCRKVFDLRIHSYLHRPREGAVFKCFFCPFYVSLKRSWLNHMRLHVDQPQDYAKQLLGNDTVENADSAACSSAAMNSEADVAESVLARDDVGGNESPNSGDNPEGVPRVWVNRGGAVQKMFKCRHCPHVSKKRSVIVTHEGMHRKRNVDAGKATYKCPHCNYTSKNAGVLTSHQKVHQGENTVHSYVADKVHGDNRSEALSMSIDSSSTMMSVSTTMEDGRLKMRIKKTDGGSASSGVAHAQSTSEKLIKAYHPCGECPAKFTKLRQMLTHRTFHGAALPWQCDHCSYAAKHRPHLHRHERVHTAEYLVNFEPPLSEQEQQTTVGGNVDDNDDDHDGGGGGGGDDDDDDDDDDDNDDARSLQAAAPVANTIVHTNKFVERKYRCQMCPAVFLKYSTLVYHMHLHNNNGKYQCTHCTYSVSNVGNLARHTKIHASTIRIVDNNLLDLSRPPFRDHLTVASSSSSVACARPTAPSGHRPVKRCKGRFACDKCPAIFDKQVRYNVHINLHGSAHRFHCDKCDYAVKFAAILIRHKALHDTEDTHVDSYSSMEAATTSSPSSLVEFSSPYVVGAKPPPAIRTTASSMAITSTTATATAKTVATESADGAASADFGFTSFEQQQQQLLQLLQGRQPTATTGVNETAVERVNELKKLFCCDRCPYVHQRKDAVQSHLKRHMSAARADASFCPHCDYGTTIHSFLREHMKLHFKPSVHHRPEGFVRMEDFEVWAQSSLWKTLVYEHRVHGKQFCEEDVIELCVADLLEKLRLKTEANDVASVVFELLTEVESVVDRDRSPLPPSSPHAKRGDAIAGSDLIVAQSALRSRHSIYKVPQSVATNLQTLRVFDCMAGSSSSSVARQLFSSSEAAPSPKKCTEQVDFLEFALSLGFSA